MIRFLFSLRHLLFACCFFILVVQLSIEETLHRKYGCDGIICYENVCHNQATRKDTHLLYQFFIKLSEQWHVPTSLLIHNYEHMLSSMYQLSLDDFVRKVPTLQLTVMEWKFALEFYLQIDIDCFYLKTCSFRGSYPRRIKQMNSMTNEGLFCVQPPEASYGMKQCTYCKCLICGVPKHRLQHDTPSIKFTDHQIHTFVNQYQARLNCDVTCSSMNVIYALTCPCQQYYYIGRANDSFSQYLYDHRVQCERIIREFLLGEHIVRRFMRTSFETDKFVYFH